jgi:hypothetical protein
MTTNTIADVLAIKSVIAVLISELDVNAIGQLRDAASDVIRNYSKHSEETKREATETLWGGRSGNG